MSEQRGIYVCRDTEDQKTLMDRFARSQFYAVQIRAALEILTDLQTDMAAVTKTRSADGIESDELSAAIRAVYDCLPHDTTEQKKRSPIFQIADAMDRASRTGRLRLSPENGPVTL